MCLGAGQLAWLLNGRLTILAMGRIGSRFNSAYIRVIYLSYNELIRVYTCLHNNKHSIRTSLMPQRLLVLFLTLFNALQRCHQRFDVAKDEARVAEAEATCRMRWLSVVLPASKRRTAQEQAVSASPRPKPEIRILQGTFFKVSSLRSLCDWHQTL